MEHNYDIRFNRQEPSSEHIAKHSDFEALLAQHQTQSTKAEAKRRRIQPYIWAAAASVAILIAAFAFWEANSDAYPSSEEYFAAQPYLNPPVDLAALPPFEALVTNEAYIDEALLQNDDQKLIVSRMRLANEYNAQPVELHHRTLDKVADFFLSGIPLGFDSLGQHLQLDVTAIIDLYATAGGQPITLAEGSDYVMDLSTSISAGSDGSLPMFFLYQLDTTNRRWEYIMEVPAQEVAEINDPIEDLPLVQDRQRLARDYARRIEELENRALNASLPPQPPLQTAQGQPTLTLDFLNGMSLAEGSNVSAEDLEALNGGSDWQITPESPAINENAFNVEWEQVRLRHISEDRYELTLINPNKEEKLIVRPIWFDTDNLAQRQARYESELAAYQADNAQALIDREEDLNELRRQKEAALSAADQAIAEYLSSLSEEEQSALERRWVNFELQLDKLGTFAVARSFTPATSNRKFNIEDETGQILKGRPVFITDGQTNSIYQTYLGNRVELPESSYDKIWLIDDLGNLQLASQDNKDGELIVTQNLGPLPTNRADLDRLLKE
ncbi:MAG: hypothetical protein AAF544_07055 [Bacteroidota bacterium]